MTKEFEGYDEEARQRGDSEIPLDGADLARLQELDEMAERDRSWLRVALFAFMFVILGVTACALHTTHHALHEKKHLVVIDQPAADETPSPPISAPWPPVTDEPAPAVPDSGVTEHRDIFGERTEIVPEAPAPDSGELHPSTPIDWHKVAAEYRASHRHHWARHHHAAACGAAEDDAASSFACAAARAAGNI